MTPYYDDGQGIAVYHGDCREVLPTMEVVDFVCVDPPYGTTQLDWDVSLDWAALWPLVYAVCKPAAVQAIFSAQPFTTDLIVSNRKHFRYELIWPKPVAIGFLDANRRPLRAHENVCIFGKQPGKSTYNPQKRHASMKSHVSRNGEASHYNKSNARSVYAGSFERYPTSVLPAFANGTGGTSDHETAKPINLLMWLVQTYSNPGDLVLDFCAGSGSTLEACKRLGRRCIGVDVRESCCELAARRLQQKVFAL